MILQKHQGYKVSDSKIVEEKSIDRILQNVLQARYSIFNDKHNLILTTKTLPIKYFKHFI